MVVAFPAIGVWAVTDGMPRSAGLLDVLGALLLFGGGAVAFYLGGIRSRICAEAEGLLVVNGVGSHRIPWGDILSASPGYFGITLVRRDGTSVTAWAVQKSNLATWGGRRTRADDVAETILGLQAKAVAGGRDLPVPDPSGAVEPRTPVGEVVEEFDRVWIWRQPTSIVPAGRAWDDRGVLRAYPHHLDFEGRQGSLVLDHIVGVSRGPLGLSTRVRFTTDGVPALALLSAGRSGSRNQRMARSIAASGAPAGAVAAAAWERFEIELRRQSSAYMRTAIFGAVIAAIGVGALFAFEGYLGVVPLIVGLAFLIGGLRTRVRLGSGGRSLRG